MKKKCVLVLGAKGMLGQALVSVFAKDTAYVVVGWDTEDIDVTDFVVAEKKIRGCAPDIIFNAVAYNAVDQCEENDEAYHQAILLNAMVPKFLAYLAADMNVILVHYSTDYVFDGKCENGYDENATPCPISRYGVSKRKGEEYVLEARGAAYIIRLSKLFGMPATSAIAKKSFFETMLDVAREKTEVMVVDDERSCFTYAPDLAQASKLIVSERAPYGVYHLPNEIGATWYEATVELFRLAMMNVIAKPVTSDAYPRRAMRPHCSILLNTKRPALRPYTEALVDFLRRR